MTFGLRLLVVGLASFGAASLIACAIVPWMARRAARATTPADLARRIQHTRLLPSWIGTASAVWASLAFVVFEPRQDEETTGVVLVALAAAALVLGSLAGLRVWRSLRATRALGGTLMRGARPVSLPGLDVPAFAVSCDFPIVAVVGVLRPRLIVAESVLAACDRDHMRAIVAHERGHLRRRDNLVRLLLTSTPDALSWSSLSRRLIDAWHEAAEDAADDDSAAAGSEGRLLLAEALIRVARLAPAGARPLALPASALFRGENVERRVRRLLDAPRVATAPVRTLGGRAMTGAAVAGLGVLTLHFRHQLVERAVTLLP